MGQCRVTLQGLAHKAGHNLSTRPLPPPPSLSHTCIRHVPRVQLVQYPVQPSVVTQLEAPKHQALHDVIDDNVPADNKTGERWEGRAGRAHIGSLHQFIDRHFRGSDRMQRRLPPTHFDPLRQPQSQRLWDSTHTCQHDIKPGAEPRRVPTSFQLRTRPRTPPRHHQAPRRVSNETQQPHTNMHTHMYIIIS